MVIVLKHLPGPTEIDDHRAVRDWKGNGSTALGVCFLVIANILVFANTDWLVLTKCGQVYESLPVVCHEVVLNDSDGHYVEDATGVHVLEIGEFFVPSKICHTRLFRFHLRPVWPVKVELVILVRVDCVIDDGSTTGLSKNLPASKGSSKPV